MPKYSSFFILPQNSIKILEESGWFFYSKKGISLEIYKLFKSKFVGVQKERESDFISYSTENMDFNFFLKGNEVFEIFIKIYSLNDLSNLSSKLNEVKSFIEFEIFDPNHVFEKIKKA